MNIRLLKDQLAKQTMLTLSIAVLGIAAFLVFSLYKRAAPILELNSLSSLIFSTHWNPSRGEFGLGGFIIGTFWVTTIAIVIALPLSILTTIFLSEYCSRKVRSIVNPIVDLLAGISPVVYGMWGMIAVVPVVRDFLMPFFSERLPFFPFASENFTGYSALSAGIVLAVMISPLIISILGEVITSIPLGLREASIALGATKWETVKKVVLNKAKPVIIASTIFGLSRALGETIAVMMVAGCALQSLPKSFFDAAYPLPALIANTYGEMMSIPLYDSAILMAALILLGITVVLNMIAWGILLYIEQGEN